jgi:hypothetical protein
MTIGFIVVRLDELLSVATQPWLAPDIQ